MNVKQHDEKRAKRLKLPPPDVDGDENDEEYIREEEMEKMARIEKSQKYLGYIGKPPRGPEK